MINPVPPAAILFAGALLVPVFKGRLKAFYLLLVPALAFLNLLYMPEGKYWMVGFLNYELIFGRVDKLSMAFGYVFVLITFIGMLYGLHIKSNTQHMASLVYAGGALGKGPEHYDIVAKGLSDMGYFTATWTPGRFPLSDVLSLAAWVNGKEIGADIGNAMYKRILHQEFPGVKMIELNGCIQAFLWTKKPVRSLADCKGLRIRTPGGHQTNYIKAVGAEPVFMPLVDVYLAMET